MRTSRRRPPLVAVVAAVAALLLASCGDEDEGAGGPATSSPTTATTVARGSVTLTQTCEADRYRVDYPSGWSTNSGEVVPRCRFFHPEPFTVPEATEVIDRAVIFDVESIPFSRMVESTGGPTEEVLDRRELTVSGRQALRVETRSTDGLLPKGTPSLRYMIDLDDATLVATTYGIVGADHDRNRAVLDAMVDTLVIRASDGCSAADLPAEPATDRDLPEPVAEMRDAIVAAATDCDFDRLAGLPQPGAFTYSFGDSGDPAAFWRRAEADSEPLAALVHFLNRPFATRATDGVTQYVWPRAYVYDSWEAVPAEDRDGLRPVYDAEDFERFDQFGSYTGYRIGITADGDWVFFVAGD